MTRSPLFTLATPAPTSATTPAPSCPRIAGNKPSGSEPERVTSSVWQMPVALISTSTSPAFGPCSCTVSMVSGAPALWATAARTSMVTPPEFDGNRNGVSIMERLPRRVQRVSRIRRESEGCVNYGTWNAYGGEYTFGARKRVTYGRRFMLSCANQALLGWTLKGGSTDDASQSYEAQGDFACRGGRSRSRERLCRARGDRFQGRHGGSLVLGERVRLLTPEQLRQFSRYRNRGACM